MVCAFDILQALFSKGSGPAGEGSDLIAFHLQEKKKEKEKEAEKDGGGPGALRVNSTARLRE